MAQKKHDGIFIANDECRRVGKEEVKAYLMAC